MVKIRLLVIIDLSEFSDKAIYPRKNIIRGVCGKEHKFGYLFLKLLG